MPVRFIVGLLACFIFIVPASAQSPAKLRADIFGDPLPESAISRLGTERLRPGRPTVALAFSPDGKTLASAHDDAIVELWETATGLRRARLASPNGVGIHRIAISPDGKYLAAGGRGWHRESQSQHCVVWLWSLGIHPQPQPRLLMEKFGHIKDFPHLGFAPDSQTLLSVTDESNAGGGWASVTRLWNPDTGEMKKEIEHPNLISGVTFLKTGRQLVTVGDDSKLRIWDLATGKILHDAVVDGSPTAVRPLVDDESVQVLVGNYDKHHIETWNVAKPQRVQRTDNHWLTDGSRVGSSVRCALFEHLPHVETVKSKVAGAYTLTTADDGKLIAAATQTRILLWDGKTGNDLLTTASHDADVGFVRFLADNKTVLTVGADQTARLWDSLTGKLLTQFPLATYGHYGALDFHPATNALVVPRGRENLESPLTVELWNVVVGKKSATLPFGPNFHDAKDKEDRVDQWTSYSQVVISPDGKTLAVINMTPVDNPIWANVFYKLRVLDATSGKVLHVLSQRYGRRPSVRFSPDGKFLAIHDDDYYAPKVGPKLFADDPRPLVNQAGTRLWDTKTWKETSISTTGAATMQPAMYFFPEGKLLGVGTRHWASKGIASFDIGKKERKLWLQNVPSNSFLAVIPGGRAALLRSASDKDLLIRDMATAKLLARLRGHQDIVQAADFSSDGKYIATACGDGTVLIWDVAAAMKRQRELASALPAAKLEELWTTLGTQPDNAIDDTLDALAAATNALPSLQKKLTPISTANLQSCLVDLDSNSFEKRDKATIELGRMEFAAKNALQNLLAGKPSLEVRQRATMLLADLEPRPAARMLAFWRAVAALEQIDTPQARELLETLAKGAADARLTREAQAVLKRLGVTNAN